ELALRREDPRADAPREGLRLDVVLRRELRGRSGDLRSLLRASLSEDGASEQSSQERQEELLAHAGQGLVVRTQPLLRTGRLSREHLDSARLQGRPGRDDGEAELIQQRARPRVELPSLV